MHKFAAIAYWITAFFFLSPAATLQTRDGKSQSGQLNGISANGAKISGKTFKWEDIRRLCISPDPSLPTGLSDITTLIWKGEHKEFPDVTATDPNSIDNVRRHYLTIRRLGNTPGAILFQGKLNVPRAGTYHFRLGSDDGARLFVGDKIVISTPAENAYRRAAKSIRLDQGVHEFKFQYINLASYAILELDWSGPNLSWTPLSAVNDWTLPLAPPAIPAAGALAWNGSYIAHPVESVNGSMVRFVSEPAGIRLSTVNAAAIFFHPLSLPTIDRIRSGNIGRKGVLLTSGDFLEGEISSIKNNVITLETLLFGAKKYQGGSQASAIFLQKPAKPKDQWIVRTQLGTEIRLNKLEWDGSTLVANRAPFRKLRIKSGEIQEIAYLSEKNLLERAWSTWALMDEQQKHQIISSQGNFNSVFKARSEAKVYLAQLDKKWRRLELEHDALGQEVKTILADLSQHEVAVRKVRSDSARTQNAYTAVNTLLNVNLHYLNPKLREAHEIKMRRLTDAKAQLESEKKIWAETEKNNSGTITKYQADRARQQQQHEKYAKDRHGDFNKVRSKFKGGLKPVEITAAVTRNRKSREFAENRRNRARDYFNQYTSTRDDARRRRDEAKRRVDAALVQRNTCIKLFQQSGKQEVNVLSARLKPAEKKVLGLRATHSIKAAVYHELIGKEAAIDQNRLNSVSNLQSVDRHVREWEGQLRSAQGKLRQDEQKKTNASRDYDKRHDLLKATRATLYEFVDKQELPALQKMTATEIRHDQLTEQAKNSPGDKGLAERLKLEKEQLARDISALKSLKRKLNALSGQYQSKLHDFANHQSASGLTQEKWELTQGDIKLIEKFLSTKKARQAELRNITDNLTRDRAGRLNKTRQAKAEMDRALNALNQALGEHRRCIAEYGTAIGKKYDAARNLEDRENTLKREQHILLQEEALLNLREKEWKRREQVFKQAEAAFVAADKAFKQAESTKASLKKPLDGDQGSLLGPLESWLQAQEQVSHFKQETVIELDKMKGELAVEHLRWKPSIESREAGLKRAELEEKSAADERIKNEKEKEKLSQALKDAEIADKTQQVRQAEVNKAFIEVGNMLRDARSRMGSKQREWVEAVFQHQKYRVQKRSVLGFE